MNTTSNIVKTQRPMRVSLTPNGDIEASWPDWHTNKWWVHIDRRTGEVIARNAPYDAFRLLVRAAREHVAV